MASPDKIEQAASSLDKVEQTVTGPDKFELTLAGPDKVEYSSVGRLSAANPDKVRGHSPIEKPVSFLF